MFIFKKDSINFLCFSRLIIFKNKIYAIFRKLYIQCDFILMIIYYLSVKFKFKTFWKVAQTMNIPIHLPQLYLTSLFKLTIPDPTNIKLCLLILIISLKNCQIPGIFHVSTIFDFHINKHIILPFQIDFTLLPISFVK